MKVRHVVMGVVVAAVSVLGVSAPALAAPSANGLAHRAAAHAPKGFLVATIDGVTTLLPPGRAVHLAQATCVGRAPAVATIDPVTMLPTTVVVAPADLTVDAVRGAFPLPVAVCAGVTLTSQVAADVAGD